MTVREQRELNRAEIQSQYFYRAVHLLAYLLAYFGPCRSVKIAVRKLRSASPIDSDLDLDLYTAAVGAPNC